MSVSNLLNPNNYNLYCDNLTLSQSMTTPIIVCESETRSKYIPDALDRRGFCLVSGDNATFTRWNIHSQGLETGNNAGSNLKISNYNDSGSKMNDVIIINRNTGKINIDADIEILNNHGLILPNGKAGEGTISGSNALISADITNKSIIVAFGQNVGNATACSGNLLINNIDIANGTFQVNSRAGNSGDNGNTFTWLIVETP